MEFSKDQEEILEKQYFGVLAYADAKDFLRGTPYTGAQITGAIGRFCRSDSSIKKPETLFDMENFVKDFIDFWIDANPEVHTDGELVLNQSVSNFMAFSRVWKEKSRKSMVFNPDYMKLTQAMIDAKNSLTMGMKLFNSRIKHEKDSGNLSKADLYKKVRDMLPEAVTIAMPIAHGLQTGELILPEGEKIEDLTRLLAAYFSGDQTLLNLSKSIKLKGGNYQYKIGYKIDD